MVSWLHHLIINWEMIQMVQCSSIDKKLNPPSAPFYQNFSTYCPYIGSVNGLIYIASVLMILTDNVFLGAGKISLLTELIFLFSEILVSVRSDEENPYFLIEYFLRKQIDIL